MHPRREAGGRGPKRLLPGATRFFFCWSDHLCPDAGQAEENAGEPVSQTAPCFGAGAEGHQTCAGKRAWQGEGGQGPRRRQRRARTAAPATKKKGVGGKAVGFLLLSKPASAQRFELSLAPAKMPRSSTSVLLLLLAAVVAVLAVAPAVSATAASLSQWGLVNDRFDMSHLNLTIADQQLRDISRATVMARAREWVDKKIPYCQCNGPAECCGSCPFCKQYRCDCSGYVSYSWGLPYGYTTFTLPQVAHPISKEELQPGDVMLNTAEHVVLFGGWADAGHTSYHALQEPGCHTAGPHYAYSSVVPYPFNWDPSAFAPYRYNNIQN